MKASHEVLRRGLKDGNEGTCLITEGVGQGGIIYTKNYIKNGSNVKQQVISLSTKVLFCCIMMQELSTYLSTLSTKKNLCTFFFQSFGPFFASINVKMTAMTGFSGQEVT
jgi:hypothetical protein